jgi:hypothetical protein
MSWGVDEAWDELKEYVDSKVTWFEHNGGTVTSGYAEIKAVQSKMEEMESREG